MFSVLLIDESHVLFAPHGLFHLRAQVVAGEIHQREIVQGVECHADHVDQRIERKQPLCMLRNDAQRVLTGEEQQDRAGKQHDVFRQGLSVGEENRIAETAAVRHGTVEVNVDRHHGHDQHENKGADGREAFAHAEQQVDAERKFHQR